MPATATPGQLRVTAPDETEQIVTLDRPVLRIGRLASPEIDLALTHNLVSRRHAQIFCDREPYRIVDMGSSNGTWVNDIPLPANEVRELHDGDRIAIGPFTLTFQAPRPAPEEQPAQPKPVAARPAAAVRPAAVAKSTAAAKPAAAKATTAEPATAEPATAEPVAAKPVAAKPAATRQTTAKPPAKPVEDQFAGLRVQEAPSVTPPAPPEVPPPGQPPSGRRLEGGTVEPWLDSSQPSRWLQYLPYYFSEDPFLGRYLLIFEDLFGSLEQVIAHFDLLLDPRTALESFLPTLAAWLGVDIDDRWPVEQRRAILRAAVELYDWRGTKKGLTRLLEASSGCAVEIVENTDGPHTFCVKLTPPAGQPVDEQMVRALIEANKPAQTVYRLEMKR